MQEPPLPVLTGQKQKKTSKNRFPALSSLSVFVSCAIGSVFFLALFYDMVRKQIASGWIDRETAFYLGVTGLFCGAMVFGTIYYFREWRRERR